MSETNSIGSCSIDNFGNKLSTILDNDDATLGNSTADNPSNQSSMQHQILHEINLLKILNNLGTPLYAYNYIIKWANNAHAAKFNFDTKYKTYHQLIKHLEQMLGMQAFCSETISVSLKGGMDEVNVVMFDVPTLIASLFHDIDLNQYENLVVNPYDRFGKYDPVDNRFGEVNSGQRYNKAYKNMI